MQADFSYEPVCDSAGCQLAVTVLADRPHVRAEMRDDAEAAGFRIIHCCTLEDFAQAKISGLGDLVLVDCAQASGTALAMLSRLDMRAGKAGAQIVVSTHMGMLDEVFGCFAMSGAQILVDADRSERVIAIGRVLAQVPNLRVRELGDDDRMMLLRLTEQVGTIAERLEKLSPGQRAGGGAFRLESPSPQWRGQDDDYVVERTPRRALPDPAVVRQVIKNRQARARFFDDGLFADPAWDILLDLTAARSEGRDVCVTSLCIAANVPATTGLRWIAQMVEANILVRIKDPEDGRRAFIALSEQSAAAMGRYFAEVGAGVALAA